MTTALVLTTGYSISFPVFSAVEVPGEAYKIEGEVQGTAFALGAEYMLTARHVLVAASSGGQYQVVVGLQAPDGFFKAARVADSEQLDADIALLKVDFVVPGSEGWFNRFKWREAPIEPFELVRSVGYGYGLQVIDDRRSVIVRGFQGHVVSRLDEFKPVGWVGKPVPAYELSFAAPCGLSGAPLLNSQGNVVVHGVVIGNSESRMLVFRSEERVGESSGVSTVEQYEALTLGIAVQASVVLNQTSKLLGMSVREHLAAHGLIV